MRDPIKPWSNHRQLLWALGVFGLIFLAFFLFLDWLLQGGFGPGVSPRPPGLPEVFGALLFAIPCIYYIAVAHHAWTRKLWIIGIVIHSLFLLFLVVAFIGSGGRGLVLLPVFFVGPLTWFGYAKRNKLSENPG